MLDITVSDVPVNPGDKGYDVALQIFRPAAESVIERSLFEVRRVFCASPAHLAQFGTPREPVDLLHYNLGLYSACTRLATAGPSRVPAGETSVNLPASIRSNSVHMLRDFVLSGGGISCLPTLVCGEDLLSGKLVVVLEDFTIPALELLAIYPVTHRRAMKVKLFVDFIAERFAGEPVWDRALREQARTAQQARSGRRSKRAGSLKGNKAAGKNNAHPKNQRQQR